jgi:hypothetical protein
LLKIKTNSYITHWYSNHEEIGDKVLTWCWDNLGSSKFQKHIKPDIIYDEVKSDLVGEWVSSDNEIIVYVNEIEDLEDYIKTIIHEYVHYLQSPIWYTRHWNRKPNQKYFEHPYEAEAELVAVMYWKVCKRKIVAESA